MRRDRRIGLVLIVLVGAVLLALPREQMAWGQDDWDAEGRADAKPMQQMHLDVEQHFNHWIFGGSDASQAREKIDSMLTLRVDSIERAGGLSKAQIERLRLAGRGDVARFFRKAASIKEECKGLGFHDQKFQKVWPRINAMQAEMNSGLFDEDSLFQKVLDGMSGSDSSTPYQEQEQERRKFRLQAAIELAVTRFEMGVPLTDVQRQRFLQVLFEQLEPPRRFGGQEQHVVFYQASKLDKEKLKPIFDEAQWRALDRAFRQAKAMESHLKQQGFIP